MRSAAVGQKQPNATVIRATENDVAVVEQEEEQLGSECATQKETQSQNGGPSRDDHITFSDAALRDTSRPRRHSHRLLNMQGVGARSNVSLHRRHSFIGQDSICASRSQAVEDDEDYEKTLKEHPSETFPPAGFSGFVGRNSQFHHLTEEEREALGGAEYKAIKVLSVIVPLYYVLWQLLSCIGIGAYVAMNRPDTALFIATYAPMPMQDSSCQRT